MKISIIRIFPEVNQRVGFALAQTPPPVQRGGDQLATVLRSQRSRQHVCMFGSGASQLPLHSSPQILSAGRARRTGCRVKQSNKMTSKPSGSSFVLLEDELSISIKRLGRLKHQVGKGPITAPADQMVLHSNCNVTLQTPRIVGRSSRRETFAAEGNRAAEPITAPRL